ncbi:hypothetical protein BO86DRAFT_122298 [Aspergillus japonicus CBS 114.51]|uniref:Uncharacterized protein n=1 Tax=Aspergillus japonicus CBS 114.51 TaxID=1448312 RepID=A0A8T8WYI6_ASPJA|nr:hypothetical protein BO86DRAFT_122298 [Aspergillus japonicus CBS 114.51]RAH80700.1 hypothetical protein BO86DRAFT_122298 [Aspergillus japonicus CBS 114.51]
MFRILESQAPAKQTATDTINTLSSRLQSATLLEDRRAAIQGLRTSDEIALWLSDEFTQRQDNITALLDLLDTRDFYSRLYSLQLMFQISSARPERTQECILTAPLGIPRLVSALGDSREPRRCFFSLRSRQHRRNSRNLLPSRMHSILYSP